MKIKVMSYNTQHCLNYLTQKIDYDLFVKTIRECGADVVGMQEMRDKGEREDFEPQAKILAEKLGYYYYFAKAIDHNGANPYGNALLSRYPIADVKTVLIPDPEIKKEGGYYETRCVLVAKILVGEKELNVVATHFGLNDDEQENAVETVLPLLSERCVLMGDFNLLPDSEIISPIRKIMTDCADKKRQPEVNWIPD